MSSIVNLQIIIQLHLGTYDLYYHIILMTKTNGFIDLQIKLVNQSFLPKKKKKKKKKTLTDLPKKLWPWCTSVYIIQNGCCQHPPQLLRLSHI